jgi:hypothetical protein
MFEHFDTPTQSPPLTLSRMHANHNCKHKNTTNKYTPTLPSVDEHSGVQVVDGQGRRLWSVPGAARDVSLDAVGRRVRGLPRRGYCDRLRFFFFFFFFFVFFFFFFFFFIAPVLAPLL